MSRMYMILCVAGWAWLGVVGLGALILRLRRGELPGGDGVGTAGGAGGLAGSGGRMVKDGDEK